VKGEGRWKGGKEKGGERRGENRWRKGCVMAIGGWTPLSEDILINSQNKKVISFF